METQTDPVTLLSRALDQTGNIIARVRLDQATLPTPCSNWDVRALINHTVLSVQAFTAMTNRTQPNWENRDVIGDDWAGAYRRAADGLLAAWSQEGVLDQQVQLPFGTFPATWSVCQQLSELAVHAWDIAKATGQSIDLDPEVGQNALEWSRENLKPEFRGGERSAFGPEVQVPDYAPLYDRLAGYFGRDPNVQ